MVKISVRATMIDGPLVIKLLLNGFPTANYAPEERLSLTSVAMGPYSDEIYGDDVHELIVFLKEHDVRTDQHTLENM
jgi:hypothetical protein